MKAIILNIMAWSILPVMDGLAKYLSLEMPVIQIIWARYFFMVIITVPLYFLQREVVKVLKDKTFIFF